MPQEAPRVRFSLRPSTHRLAAGLLPATPDQVSAATRACTLAVTSAIDLLAKRQAREMVAIHGVEDVGVGLWRIAQKADQSPTSLCPDPETLAALVTAGLSRFPAFIERAAESVLRRGIRSQIGWDPVPSGHDSWFTAFELVFRYSGNLSGPNDPGHRASAEVSKRLNIAAGFTRWLVTAGLPPLSQSWISRVFARADEALSFGTTGGGGNP